MYSAGVKWSAVATIALGLCLLAKYWGGDVYTRAAGLHKQPLPPGWKWDEYHNHDQVAAFLAWLHRTHQGLADLHSIGQSVEGRELFVVKLSGRQATNHQGKVAVKLVGGIHGNEQACPELLLRLLHYLSSHYGRCQRITHLLDTTDIHVLPVMNPDGRELDTRFNARGMDLNRNFPLDPLPFDPPGPASDNDTDTVKTWRKVGSGPPQPEVSAVMAWSKAHDFHMSASLHQGALVANYPFDSCDTQGLVRSCPTPDDPLPLFLAAAYAANNPAMRLNNNDSFVQGTVQGAQWYTLLGGMQDYMYWDRNSMELTLELNPVMKPPAHEVAGVMWKHNLPALLRFIELAHLGLEGRLTDAHTSKPLMGHVEVLAPSRHRAVNITHPAGFFNIMLAPDTVYCLVIYPQDPHHKHTYHAVKVAALHLGGGAVMTGKGLKGLTQQADFLAERHTGSSNGAGVEAELDAPAAGVVHVTAAGLTTAAQQPVPASARRLLHPRSIADAVVLLGQATPDMCWFGGH